MSLFAMIATSLIFALLPAPATLYDQNGTAITSLPATYFVAVIEPDSEYTFVNYYDISGYVKNSEIETVDYEPVTKYETTVKFKANNDNQPINLRSEPDHTKNNVLRILPADSEGYCYGNVSGSALIDVYGNKWYYVRVGPDNLRGYVYSMHVDVSATPENIIDKIVNTTPQDPEEEPLEESPTNILSNTRTIIFIVALTVPAIFIMYLLFKKPRDKTKAD